jgi:hypothetical protein
MPAIRVKLPVAKRFTTLRAPLAAGGGRARSAAGGRSSLSLPWLFALLAALVPPGAARAQEDETAAGTERAARESQVRVLGDEITSQLRLAVTRGYRFLVSQQRPSGSIGDSFPVAGNALAGLAFLAGGHTNHAGDYALPMERLVSALLGYQKPDNGYFRDDGSRMYGHGFATLFLAELYGMTGARDREIRSALSAAIRLIERSQCPDGGWDYFPSRSEAPELLFNSLYSNSSDTSITVCQTMALRAARNLGITIDSQVIGKAKAFIETAQNADGGFAYRLVNRKLPLMSDSQLPRSAAGVCILLSLGEYSSPRIRDGFDYLLKNYRASNRFPFYADYYCAQAMFQAGGRYWREYFPHAREKLLSSQESNGSWSARSEQGGDVVATAMALIVLQVPYRYLPISER